MKQIAEAARSVDVVLETDVLVVGSGPGGLAAALAAARAGARTALIDRNGCFGGNITQVGVEGFAWYRHEHTVDCEGIGIEFETRAKAMGAAMPEPQGAAFVHRIGDPRDGCTKTPRRRASPAEAKGRKDPLPAPRRLRKMSIPMSQHDANP